MDLDKIIIETMNSGKENKSERSGMKTCGLIETCCVKKSVFGLLEKFWQRADPWWPLKRTWMARIGFKAASPSTDIHRRLKVRRGVFRRF